MPEFSPEAATLDLPRLRAAFDGRVVAPGDPGYDQARALFYGGWDRRPGAIVRPADAAQGAVVTMAHDLGLELAVRGGGHSNAGHSTSDGGIVLDLSELTGLDIDVGGRAAWAQGGLTAGAYTAAVGAHGLATGFGDTGSVGIGGITLGGGVGFLVRKHSLTIDNLLAAELVTADGRILEVDANHHPGAVLGDPGWRGELRGGHPPAVPAPRAGLDRGRDAAAARDHRGHRRVRRRRRGGA